MFNATATKDAPWFVIPADDKWYSRILIGAAIYQEFQKLNIAYPKVSKEAKAALEKAKVDLLNEK
jgi:hypothetical protein